MATRNEIVNWAIWESNYGSWKPTDYEIVEIFEQAGLSPPTARDLKKFATASGNVPVNGKSIAWCGIFTTYLLKKWGKLDVKWSGGGIVGKGVNKTWDNKGMKAGDVAVVRGKDKNGGPVHHHFMITHIDYPTNVLQSVDGNSTNNCIVWHTDKKIYYSGADKNIYTPYCHYKLNI